MRKLLFAVLCALAIGPTTGCIIPGYSADPSRRTAELIWTSENFRLIYDEWERLWYLDQPDHSTPYRTHGGLI